MDENSSLRSLNMSLIYEREKLLRELRQCDSEMVSMQRTVDGLLQSSSQPGPGKDNNAALCQGFRLLCNKLVRKARSHSSDNPEIPLHLRQVLEACFDKYDEFQRQYQVNADEDECDITGGMRPSDSLPPLSLRGAAEPDSAHRDFSELSVSKNGCGPRVSVLPLCSLFAPSPWLAHLPRLALLASAVVLFVCV